MIIKAYLWEIIILDLQLTIIVYVVTYSLQLVIDWKLSDCSS